MNANHKVDARASHREHLANNGVVLSKAFLQRNGVKPVRYGIDVVSPDTGFSGGYGCGWYRSYSINRPFPFMKIAVKACARPAVGVARSWSFPGYKTDRTPVGVIAHETGHHIDAMLGILRHGANDLQHVVKQKITSYEPNTSELIAETLRLFILNPDLLSIVAPDRFWYMRHVVGLVPSEERDCLAVLRGWVAPQTYLDAVKKRLGSF